MVVQKTGGAIPSTTVQSPPLKALYGLSWNNLKRLLKEEGLGQPTASMECQRMILLSKMRHHHKWAQTMFGSAVMEFGSAGREANYLNKINVPLSMNQQWYHASPARADYIPARGGLTGNGNMGGGKIGLVEMLSSRNAMLVRGLCISPTFVPKLLQTIDPTIIRPITHPFSKDLINNKNSLSVSYSNSNRLYQEALKKK